MSKVITFYDIPSAVPENAWSPNCWKIRLVLNYKNLPYKTVWVEFPDIVAKCKELGVGASGIHDNAPEYTLPIIHDPSTGTTLTESTAIVEYLEKQYPNHPTVFPLGSHALQYAFLDWFGNNISPAWRYLVAATNGRLNPPGEKYFRAKREKQFGMTIETMAPTGDEHIVEWAKIKAVFDTIDKWVQKGDGRYLGGEQPGFADFVLTAFLLWMKGVWRDGHREWEDIKTWNEGRWIKYLEGLQNYQKVIV